MQLKVMKENLNNQNQQILKSHSHNRTQNQSMTEEHLIKLLFHKNFTEKRITKPFTNKKLLGELPFHKCFLKRPNITKCSKAFKSYEYSYKFEVLMKSNVLK